MNRILIAKSVEHGISSAQIDYGWKRTGSRDFIDHQGIAVRVIAGIHQLKGLRPHRIYLGYEACSNKDFDEVDHFIRTRFEIEVRHHHETIQLVKEHNASKQPGEGNE